MISSISRERALCAAAAVPEFGTPCFAGCNAAASSASGNRLEQLLLIFLDSLALPWCENPNSHYGTPAAIIELDIPPPTGTCSESPSTKPRLLWNHACKRTSGATLPWMFLSVASDRCLPIRPVQCYTPTYLDNWPPSQGPSSPL